jgi:hypothetical protein
VGRQHLLLTSRPRMRQERATHFLVGCNILSFAPCPHWPYSVSLRTKVLPHPYAFLPCGAKGDWFLVSPEHSGYYVTAEQRGDMRDD